MWTFLTAKMPSNSAGGKKQKELTQEQKQDNKEAFDWFDADGFLHS